MSRTTTSILVTTVVLLPVLLTGCASPEPLLWGENAWDATDQFTYAGQGGFEYTYTVVQMQLGDTGQIVVVNPGDTFQPEAAHLIRLMLFMSQQSAMLDEVRMKSSCQPQACGAGDVVIRESTPAALGLAFVPVKDQHVYRGTGFIYETGTPLLIDDIRVKYRVEYYDRGTITIDSPYLGEQVAVAVELQLSLDESSLNEETRRQLSAYEQEHGDVDQFRLLLHWSPSLGTFLRYEAIGLQAAGQVWSIAHSPFWGLDAPRVVWLKSYDLNHTLQMDWYEIGSRWG